MRYYFDINTYIVTTKALPNISIFSLNLAKYRIEGKYRCKLVYPETFSYQLTIMSSLYKDISEIKPRASGTIATGTTTTKNFHHPTNQLSRICNV